MSTAKVAVSLHQQLLAEVDHLVSEKVFRSRSQAVQIALEEKLARLRRSRLARECSKLDPKREQAMAEEGMAGELSQWPAY